MSTSTYYPVCIKNIRIYAWDNQGHQTTSNISTFVVGNSDQIGPYIRMISGPEIIISTETSKISVNGTDASEVTAVILSYNNGQAWINNSMSQNGTIWMGEIPPPGDVPTLQYKVFAKDTWGQWSVSEISRINVDTSESGDGDVFLNNPIINFLVPIVVLIPIVKYKKSELFWEYLVVLFACFWISNHQSTYLRTIIIP